MDPAVQAALTGGLVSTAGDLLGAGLSFGLGQAAAGQQWDKWKDSQTRGPLYRLIGLEEAGLNPILAAKGGLGGGGGGFTPTAVASGGGGLPLGSNATRAAKEIGLMRDQSRSLRAQKGQQDSQASLNKAMERIKKIDRDIAEQALRLTTANANAVEEESLSRQATAIIDQERAKWYYEHPNVYIAKDLVGGMSQLINSATNFISSFPTSETVVEDKWSEDHGDTRTSGSKTTKRRSKLNKLFRK